MKTMNLTNIGILAGALAIGFLIYRAKQNANALQSINTPVQYGSNWEMWPQREAAKIYV